jgi:hypothetical protein
MKKKGRGGGKGVFVGESGPESWRRPSFAEDSRVEAVRELSAQGIDLRCGVTEG